jgi:hypothetical protein
MSILKSVLTLIIVWFLGLQYTLIAQTKDTPIDQMKNSQTNKVSEETREREARAQQVGSRPTKVNRALKVNGILTIKLFHKPASNLSFEVWSAETKKTSSRRYFQCKCNFTLDQRRPRLF